MTAKKVNSDALVNAVKAAAIRRPSSDHIAGILANSSAIGPLQKAIIDNHFSRPIGGHFASTQLKSIGASHLHTAREGRRLIEAANLAHSPVAGVGQLLVDAAYAEVEKEQDERIKSLPDTAGIYAFSYKKYLEHPETEDGKYLYKLGIAGSLKSRHKSRNTDVPEERIYLGYWQLFPHSIKKPKVREHSPDYDKLLNAESQIHSWLKRLQPINPYIVRETGKEWFVGDVQDTRDLFDQLKSLDDFTEVVDLRQITKRELENLSEVSD